MTDTVHPTPPRAPDPSRGEPTHPIVSSDHAMVPTDRDSTGPPRPGDDPERAAGFERRLRDRRLGLLALLGFFALLGLSFGFNVILLVLAVVVTIFLHELGHYAAARWSGMKVSEFFIGFGPRIWSFRRGETEYGVKMVWAGAYVKIVGMNNLEEVAPADEPLTYRRQSYPKRVLVAFAGPAMNFVFAFVLLVGLATAWGIPRSPQWPQIEVGAGGAAAVAGLEDGDRLLTFAGEPVPDDFGAFAGRVSDVSGGTVDVQVERGGDVLTVPVTLGTRVLGVSGSEWPEVHVAPGSAAGEGSLGPGDRIVSVGGADAPADFDGFVDEVLTAAGGDLVLVVERDGTEYQTVLAVPADVEPAGFLGVSRYYPDPEPAHPVAAVPDAADTFTDLGWASVYGLYRFFSPSGLTGFADRIVSTPPVEDSPPTSPVVETLDDVPAEDQLPVLPAYDYGNLEDEERVHSVLGIVAIGSQLSTPAVVFLFALLNIFLAIFNLIPLLPFDGGHIAVATYERIREGLARAGWVKAPLVGTRYMADFRKLIPITYAVVALIVVVGLGALWLDAIDPPSLSN